MRAIYASLEDAQIQTRQTRQEAFSNIRTAPTRVARCPAASAAPSRAMTIPQSLADAVAACGSTPYIGGIQTAALVPVESEAQHAPVAASGRHSETNIMMPGRPMRLSKAQRQAIFPSAASVLSAADHFSAAEHSGTLLPAAAVVSPLLLPDTSAGSLPPLSSTATEALPHTLAAAGCTELEKLHQLPKFAPADAIYPGYQPVLAVDRDSSGPLLPPFPYAGLPSITGSNSGRPDSVLVEKPVAVDYSSRRAVGLETDQPQIHPGATPASLAHQAVREVIGVGSASSLESPAGTSAAGDMVAVQSIAALPSAVHDSSSPSTSEGKAAAEVPAVASPSAVIGTHQRNLSAITDTNDSSEIVQSNSSDPGGPVYLQQPNGTVQLSLMVNPGYVAPAGLASEGTADSVLPMYQMMLDGTYQVRCSFGYTLLHRNILPSRRCDECL